LLFEESLNYEFSLAKDLLLRQSHYIKSNEISLSKVCAVIDASIRRDKVYITRLNYGVVSSKLQKCKYYYQGVREC